MNKNNVYAIFTLPPHGSKGGLSENEFLGFKTINSPNEFVSIIEERFYDGINFSTNVSNFHLDNFYTIEIYSFQTEKTLFIDSSKNDSFLDFKNMCDFEIREMLEKEPELFQAKLNDYLEFIASKIQNL